MEAELLQNNAIRDDPYCCEESVEVAWISYGDPQASNAALTIPVLLVRMLTKKQLNDN